MFRREQAASPPDDAGCYFRCDLLFVGWFEAANFDPADVRFLRLIMEPGKTNLFARSAILEFKIPVRLSFFCVIGNSFIVVVSHSGSLKQSRQFIPASLIWIGFGVVDVLFFNFKI